MKKALSLFATAVALTVIAGTVAAGVNPPAHTDLLPTLSLAQARAVVASASKGQAVATSVFEGVDGLVGAVYTGAGGARGIVWLTDQGNAVLDGTLLGRDGSDLTKEAMYAHGLLLTPQAALVKALGSASRGINVGNAGPLITVFFDPNCTYCHIFYNALTPKIAAGKVRVRYVAVGTLKPTSIPRAASILGAPEPVKALAQDESGFDNANEEGGFPIDAKVSDSMKAVVTSNNDLFKQTGLAGTPAILYCSKASADVQLLSGIPSDVEAFVAAATTCR
ncbi:MAG: thioredoxin fold domain-containing protein [Rhodanobacter sp.]